MKSPKYHVQEVNLEIHPNLEDVDIGRSALDFEVDEVPEYNQNLSALEFETELHLEFLCYEDTVRHCRAQHSTEGTVRRSAVSTSRQQHQRQCRLHPINPPTQLK